MISKRFIHAASGIVLFISLTCMDSTKVTDRGNHQVHERITQTQVQSAQINLDTTLSSKSENSDANNFVLIVPGKLSTTKRFYVNGPLADVCIGTLKNEGNFKVTGKLSLGTLQNTGELQYEEFKEGVTCNIQVSPPSITEFIRDQNVIWFGNEWVEEYSRDGSLVKRVEGKFYKDPSGAEWLYKNDGS